MKLNPIAVVFWVFCACLGFIFGGTGGAVIGITTALGLSLMASFL